MVCVRGGFELSVYAPLATRVDAILDDADGGRAALRAAVRRLDGRGARRRPVPAADRRRAAGARSTSHRGVVPAGPFARRREARRGARSRDVPAAVARPWPAPRPQRHTDRPLVVYEAHVRGLTKLRDRADAGTFARGRRRTATARATRRVRARAAAGSPVRSRRGELLGVHAARVRRRPPAVRGDRRSGHGTRRPRRRRPRPRHRGVARRRAQPHDRGGRARVRPTTCGRSPTASTTSSTDDGVVRRRRRNGQHRRRHLAAGAGAGHGGARPASPTSASTGSASISRAVLARDADFVRSIGDWAERRGVRLVAEPWDIARYLLGRGFPDERWMQWNDRFRDDMRGFLRGEPGLVPSVAQRLAGQPRPLRASPMAVGQLPDRARRLHDVRPRGVRPSTQRRQRLGQHRRPPTTTGRGTADGRATTACPTRCSSCAERQLRNAMCLLLLSHGVPMFVAGDEFARTQHGNNNPYNQDNETSWIDWARGRRVRRPRAIRRAADRVALGPSRALADHRTGGATVSSGSGVDGGPDLSFESRSIACHRRRPLRDGQHVVGTARLRGAGCRATGGSSSTRTTRGRRPSAVGPATSVTVGPRSIVVLEPDLATPQSVRARHDARRARSSGVEAEAEAVEGAQPGVALAGLVLAVHRPSGRLDAGEAERLGRERQRLVPDEVGLGGDRSCGR